jgi:precorrin-3B C17-methyltransferase
VSGSLAVIGLGPGNPQTLTSEAAAALDTADALYGYGPYLDRVPPRAGQIRHASDNREEGGAGGVTAMLAVAARVGAPLGHDFCAISLSDNLKPWGLIERRLAAAAGAGFVIALYNPISRVRPWQLGKAFELLRHHLPASTPVIFGRAIGRPDEKVVVSSLKAVDPSTADMATLIIVGSSLTRVIERPGLEPLVYTPRSAPDTSA